MRLILTAIAVFACALCASAQEANALKNPGFEQPSSEARPRDWAFADFGTGGTQLWADEGRDGGKAVGVTSASDTQRGAWRQTIGIKGISNLHVSGWYRTDGLKVSPGNGACVRMTYLKEGTGWEFINDKRLTLAPSEGWQAFETVFATTPGAARVCIELFNFFVPGTVWWDDVTIRPATDDEVIALMAQKLDRSANPDEVSYSPEDGQTVSVNPPAFIWCRAGDVEKYVLQYSPSPDFPGDATTTVEDIPLSVFTPTETVAPGKWYWRYGFRTGDGLLIPSKTRSFTLPESATPYPRPTIESVLEKIPAIHPRIYFTPESVKDIRENRATTYAGLTRGTISAAEKLLGAELYPEPDWLPQDPQERGKAYLKSFQTMRPFTSGMETCALAYVYSGDRRFADEARRRLLHFSTWDVEGPSSVFHDDEAAMDIIMRGPRTFDWIYDTLSDEERATCADFLCRRLAQTNLMHRRMPFDARPYSSHPGRMIGFMIEGSIVFAHDAPEAAQWLDYTLRLLWSVYPIWGSDDGGWHEGISYWTAYNSMMFMMVAELDRLGIPFKDKPYLQNTGWFGLYCAYPKRRHTAFGDGQEGAIGGGQGSVLYALSSIYENPYFRWYAEQTGGAAGGPTGYNLMRPDIQAKPPSDIPQARAFPHVGWVAMHSRMDEPRENIMLLLHSSPYGAISHNHANQNAFVLEAYTAPLAISSGYYQRYGCPHHMDWTWETKSHNCILVDGQGQVKRNALSRGYVTEFENTDDFAYTTGDATEAYGGRLTKFLRHVLFCRPGYFVIVDELESKTESNYQWLLHAKNEMRLDPDKLRLTSEFENARLRVQFLTPTELTFSQTDQFSVPPEKADSPNQYHFTASTVAPARTMRFVTVLSPYREGEEGTLPLARLLEAEGGVALQVGEDLLAWKDEEAEMVQAGGLTSEAAVTAIRRDAQGAVVSVFTLGEGKVSLNGASVSATGGVGLLP